MTAHLYERITVLETALENLTKTVHMRIDPANRVLWYCPLCFNSSKNLDELERGFGHTIGCSYAEARKLLKYWR